MWMFVYMDLMLKLKNFLTYKNNETIIFKRNIYGVCLKILKLSHKWIKRWLKRLEKFYSNISKNKK